MGMGLEDEGKRGRERKMGEEGRGQEKEKEVGRDRIRGKGK